MDRSSVDDIPLDQLLLPRDFEAANYFADDEYLDDDKAALSQFSIFMLAVGLGGLQLIFATEYSCGTPYLLSLGLTKSAVSLIWISGPLAGAVVQPICGFLSDRCQHSWGPRRPYIVAGSFSAIVSLTCFAWSEDIVRIILECLPFQAFKNAETVHYATTTFAVFWLSVLNVAIQLIQGGLRSLIAENCPSNQQEQVNAWASRVIQAANVFGYSTNLINLPHFLPWVGKTQLQALASITSFALVATITSSCLSVQEKVLGSDEKTVVKSRHPLSQFKQYFKVSKGLSPKIRRVFKVQFLVWIAWAPFYLYITTYIAEMYLVSESSSSKPSESEQQTRWSDVTRRASISMLGFSVSSLFTSVVLPLLVRTNSKGGSIYVVWAFSIVLLAVCTFSLSFMTDPVRASIIVTFVGISWAVSSWVPFAIISEDIARRNSYCEENPANFPAVNTGTIMGFHNVAIAVPQLVAALVSWGIFGAFGNNGGQPGGESIRWILSCAGCAAAAAAAYLLHTSDTL